MSSFLWYTTIGGKFVTTQKKHTHKYIYIYILLMFFKYIFSSSFAQNFHKIKLDISFWVHVKFMHHITKEWTDNDQSKSLIKMVLIPNFSQHKPINWLPSLDVQYIHLAFRCKLFSSLTAEWIQILPNANSITNASTTRMLLIWKRHISTAVYTKSVHEARCRVSPDHKKSWNFVTLL